MTDRLVTSLGYFGISPWEIEVIYGIFNERFKVTENEISQIDPNFDGIIIIKIPLPYNDEFFNWFEFRRWEKVKAIFKEMNRRRGKNHPLKIDLRFSGNPSIRFVVDVEARNFFNTAIDKIHFVLELIQYHLDPEKLPQDVSEVIYNFDPKAVRWRLKTAFVENNKFTFTDNGWKLIT